MPDTSVAVPIHPAPPPPSVPPTYDAWTVALREQILGEGPEPENVGRIRALLTYLYSTRPERLRALQALFATSPATYRCVAEECGWSAELELLGVSWDLALIALLSEPTKEVK